MDKPGFKKLHTVLADSALFKNPPEFKRATIYRMWRQVVGASIAENTIELTIDNNMLNVAVNSPTWAHELINQQNSILKNLHGCGFENLTEMSVRIRVANVRSSPAPQKKYSKPQTITPQMRELFARLASESADPETKETFMRLSRTSTGE